MDEHSHEEQLDCIADHPGFASVCLDVWVLETAYYQYRQQEEQTCCIQATCKVVLGIPETGFRVQRHESQSTISAVLDLLKTVLPEDRFLGMDSRGQRIIITDDCQLLSKALHFTYPPEREHSCHARPAHFYHLQTNAQ